jgi:hypothetical protein
MLSRWGTRRESVNARIPAQETAEQPEVISMSVITFRQTSAEVFRSRYLRLRTLLAVALVAVVGLTYAVVVLAGSDRPETVMIAKQPQPRAHHFDLTVSNSACVASAETGERIDHRGRR